MIDLAHLAWPFFGDAHRQFAAVRAPVLEEVRRRRLDFRFVQQPDRYTFAASANQ